MKILIRYFWIFVLGSFLGFICETIWCILKNRKIESRKGLIYGHFIPIYGIATIFISMFFEITNIENPFIIFLVTFIVCGIVEYLSSVFLEKCLSFKSWDYTNFVLNLHGRVNLLYLLAWSFIGVVWCKIYPRIINGTYNLIDNKLIYNIISIICIILMLYNCFISFVASYRQKKRRKGIEPRNNCEKWLDKKYTDEYLKKVYTNATFIEIR